MKRPETGWRCAEYDIIVNNYEWSSDVDIKIMTQVHDGIIECISWTLKVGKLARNLWDGRDMKKDAIMKGVLVTARYVLSTQNEDSKEFIKLLDDS